jgi:hypothetical protein
MQGYVHLRTMIPYLLPGKKGKTLEGICFTLISLFERERRPKLPPNYNEAST